MTDKSRRLFLAYLAILSIAGGATIYLATSKIGPGVSTDAAMMLSTAENVLRGRGLVDYRGVELTQFPPLYSLILALGGLLFRQDVFTVGWVLAILVFAATIWFSGVYFFQAFREFPILAYVASFIVFSSTSLIEISANIASDPLFLLMVVWFLLLMTNYAMSGRVNFTVLAAVLTVLACFERYAGLSLVISGALIVALTNRVELRRAILSGSLFAVSAGTPILLWGYLHNAPISGTAFGGRLPSIPALNFETGVEKVLYWFVPLRIISLVGPLLLLGLIVTSILAALLLTKSVAAFRQLLSSQVMPSVVFLLVYAAVLTFDISYYELRGINTDRVHIILLPSLLVTVFTIGMPLLRAAATRFGPRLAYAATVLLFLVWSAYPLTRTDEYVYRSMLDGDVSSYNSINKGDIRTSPLARFLSTLDLNEKKVYTNGSDSAWFILHTQIKATPILNPDNRLTSLQQEYAGWPGVGQDGYIIWFNSEAHKEAYARPEEIGSIAMLQQLYQDQDGTVYYVSSR